MALLRVSLLLLLLRPSHAGYLAAWASPPQRAAAQGRPSRSECAAISCVVTETAQLASPFAESWFERTLDARTATPSSGALEGLRSEAEQVLRGLGLPRRKQEAWRRTDLASLFATALVAPAGVRDAASIDEYLEMETSQGMRLVLVDGVFDSELSDLSSLPPTASIGACCAPQPEPAFFSSPRCRPHDAATSAVAAASPPLLLPHHRRCHLAASFSVILTSRLCRAAMRVQLRPDPQLPLPPSHPRAAPTLYRSSHPSTPVRRSPPVRPQGASRIWTDRCRPRWSRLSLSCPRRMPTSARRSAPTREQRTCTCTCTCHMHMPHAHAACTCHIHIHMAHAICHMHMHMPHVGSYP